jgi:hypothetical protein
MDVGREQITTEGNRRSGRRIAFAVLSGIFAAGAFGGLFGLGLLIGWFDNADAGIHRVHDVGFGILYGVVLTVAFVALTRRSWATPAAFLQVVATALAALIAALASTDADDLFLGLSVAVAAAIVLWVHPARGELLRSSLKPSPAMSAFVLLGAIPLVWFGLTMAGLQRTGFPSDPHVSMDHWANMAATAFGLCLTGLLACSRIRGWRLSAWCAGIGLAVYGLASTVFHRFPGTNVPYPGSEGTAWGVAALIGGLAFIAVGQWEAGRPPPFRDPSSAEED